MSEPKEEKLIERLKTEIVEDNEQAINMLCLLLSCTKKFQDKIEWGFFLGKLFSVILEGALLKDCQKLLYDEAGEAITDYKIEEILKKFSIREKVAIWAFLDGASKPLSLDKIEELAGRNL